MPLPNATFLFYFDLVKHNINSFHFTPLQEYAVNTEEAFWAAQPNQNHHPAVVKTEASSHFDPQPFPFFDTMPSEIILSILIYLPLSDLIAFAKTSKLHNQVCNDTAFWQNKIKSEFAEITLNSSKEVDYKTVYGQLSAAKKIIDRYCEEINATISYSCEFFFNSLETLTVNITVNNSPNLNNYEIETYRFEKNGKFEFEFKFKPQLNNSHLPSFSTFPCFSTFQPILIMTLEIAALYPDNHSFLALTTSAENALAVAMRHFTTAATHSNKANFILLFLLWMVSLSQQANMSTEHDNVYLLTDHENFNLNHNSQIIIEELPEDSSNGLTNNENSTEIVNPGANGFFNSNPISDEGPRGYFSYKIAQID